MDTSLWQDEAELANVFLEEDRNRRSSGSSSPGYHFTSTLSLKRNLTSTFDKELPDTNMLISNHLESNISALPLGQTSSSENQSMSRNRPPLPGDFPVRSKPSKRSKKNFSVYLRIRPLSPHSSGLKGSGKSTIEVVNPSGDSKNPASFPTTIRTYPPNLSNTYKMNINRPSRDNSAYAKEFNFDRVIGPETSQETVYSTVAAPLIKDLLDQSDTHQTSKKKRHKTALLFSYGITNAGKTHTILGDMSSTNESDWGIIPRTIHDIFRQTRTHSMSGDSKSGDKNWDQKPPSNLYISFFEVYNENVFDLMPTSKSNSSKYVNYSPPALKVRECRGQIFVRGLAKHRISTIAQGIELTKKAHQKRHTSSNNLNSDSSRSHFVCQVQIVPVNQTSGSFVESKVGSNFEDNMSGYSTDQEATMQSRNSARMMWIVDLAGSERSKRTKIGGTRQKESTKINNSLMTLMRCLNAMKKEEKKGLSKNVIPFRESKLTHIFMGHLTSECAAQTAMMVNVNPSVEDFDETQHVLAYARKAKLIEIDMREYSIKQKKVFGEEYDHNGRKRPRWGEENNSTGDMVSKKPKTTLMARIVQKLSPKKYSAKQVASAEVEQGNALSNKHSVHNEETAKLKKSLKIAKDKIKNLENQNVELLDELDRKEDQIRAEVSTEMEQRLRETRAKHNEKYEQLKSLMRHQVSKADISVSMNRAGTQLEELMDKIDECEKEMIRMTQDHHQTVKNLNSEIEEMRRKQKFAENEKVKDKARISRLEEALKVSNEEIQRLKKVQDTDKREREGKVASKDTESVKSAKYKRKLRPRKPLGNSTNQTDISRVFAIDGDY